MTMETFEELLRIVRRAEHLGSRELPSGVRLIGNVAHVAPEAYFHVIFPPLDEVQIVTLEREVGRPLPSELQEFYRCANGLLLFTYSISLFGLRHSYARQGDEAWQPHSILTPNVQERPADVSGSLVLFGSYRSDGSMLVMSSESPKVFRFARGTNSPLNEWSSFDDMLLSEAHRLSRLFDEQGKLIDETAPTTPTTEISQ